MKLPSRAPVQAMSGVTLMQFNFPLDLYRDVGRQLCHPDRAPCVRTYLPTKYLDDQLRTPIDHCRLVVESWSRVDHPKYASPSLYRIEASKLPLQAA